MDWRKYAKHLEDIIGAIDLSEDRRIIVDAFVNDARKKCLADGGDFIEEVAKLKAITDSEEYASQLARIFLGGHLDIKTVLLMAMDFGKQCVDGELKRLADAMYTAAQHLTTDASQLRKAMEEYHQFVINKYCAFNEITNKED